VPDAVGILKSLVAIPSVSALSNRPLVDFCAGLLRQAGWSVDEFAYAGAGGVEKVNIIARPLRQQSDAAVATAFVCHTDTVPFAASWASATNLVESEGMLHGCGACDVKGSLAGILAAIAAGPGRSYSQSVALVLTADEEIGCIGATRLIAANVIRPRQVIVCEPTGLRPASAGKGYGLARVHVKGREAHSAFPQHGASAVYAAAAIVRAIEGWAEQLKSQHNPLFDPPHTTVNVGVIHGGSAKNIVAGECEFLVEWRPLPGEDLGAAARALQDIVQGQARTYNCEAEVEVQRAEPGFQNPADSRLVERLAALTGREITGIPFGSEATRFARVAEEVVVVGPGDMRSAHSERECIPRAELEHWAAIVSQLLG
jgi:acetylornithine deacetylase